MKSFFKKLAFVMAMAMVVSLAAPAAANAAEGDIYLCYQLDETKKEVEMHAMKIGDTQDFRFIGAPKDWKELGWKWETTDPTVATVDVVSGDVTAVAAGTTTLNFILGGEVVATAEIVVSAPSTKDQFEATQTSYKELTLKFAEDTEIKSETVKLFLMLPNEEDPENPIEVPWPVVAHKNVDKKTITVQPTVEPGNGDVIKVVAGSFDDEVTTVVAKPDTVVISYKGSTNGDMTVDGKASVEAKLYANGGKIDVTDKYSNDYIVKYTESIVDPEKFDKNDYYFYVDASNDYVATAELFEVGMQLAVKATLIDKDKKEVATSGTLSFTCVETKDWTFDGKVVDWAIVKNDATFVNWDDKTIPADASPAGEYSIVLKFKDGNEKTYVTHKAACQEGKNEGAAENILIDGSDEISKNKYEVSFFSTNPDVMLVDEVTGALGVYIPANVTFYVGLDYDYKPENRKYIFARGVEITEATKLDDVTIKDNKRSIEILTEALESGFLSSETITMEAWDQYDKTWTQVEYTAYYKNSKNEPVAVGTVDGSNITFTSADFVGLTGTVTVTIEGKTTNVLGNNEKDSATLYVNLTIPAKDSNGKIKLDQIAATRYKTYTAVAIGAPELDINAVVKTKDAAGNEVVTVYPSKTGYITLYKTSNNAKVGTYTKDDGFVAVTSKEQLATLEKGAEGTRYVVLKDTNGNVIPLDWTPSGDKLQYTINNTVKTASGDKIAYAATGAYKVEAVTVRYNERNTSVQDNYSVGADLNVKNSATKVELDGWKSKTFGAGCYEWNVSVDAENNPVYQLKGPDTKKVILETIKFKNATITADDIIEYKQVVLGNSVITQYVKVRVFVDAAKTVYYEEILKPELVAVTWDKTVPAKPALPEAE